MTLQSVCVSEQPKLIFHDDALFRLTDLFRFRIVPFSRATLYRRITQGTFPRPVKVSDAVKAWRWRDLKCWLEDPARYPITARAGL